MCALCLKIEKQLNVTISPHRLCLMLNAKIVSKSRRPSFIDVYVIKRKPATIHKICLCHKLNGQYVVLPRKEKTFPLDAVNIQIIIKPLALSLLRERDNVVL